MSTHNKTKIFITDDHPVVRRGLKEIIEGDPDFMVCGEAASVQETLEKIKSLKIDIIIVDILLNGVNAGIDLIKDIKKINYNLPILVLSMHEDPMYVKRSLKAGATGYVTKNQMEKTLIKAIKQVLKGILYVSDEMAHNVLETFLQDTSEENNFLIDSLSDRELEVFRLIGKGYSSRRIANSFNLSIKTIDSYRENIKKKLNFNSSTELVYSAIQWIQSKNTPG
jgi:DNA-binding NarL/FixJ family response regulator